MIFVNIIANYWHRGTIIIDYYLSIKNMECIM